MGAPLVRCDNLTVEYRRRGQGRGGAWTVQALRGISLQIGRGETVGVVGESGSGKSTLARAIVQQVALTSGSVDHLPRDGDRRPLGARVSMIFQDPKSSLNPRLSVRSILADPLVVHGRCNRATRTSRVEQLLADVGLPSGLSRRRARQLSGGQLQRVAIARALALDPDLIVADEPTSALDVSVQAQVVNLLRRLRQERDFAMLLVSHDMRVVRALADRVVVMYDGMIVEEGPADEIYERPQHPYTATLLASATTVAEAAAGEADRATHLLGLPRPFAERSVLQRDCCPFADRCWQAREACVAEVPVMRGEHRSVRCVAPLDESARGEALGVPGRAADGRA
ncbi:MAG: peptide/nickel transport system ATP-binding protein [Solirubrobacteraceae bacterium]